MSRPLLVTAGATRNPIDAMRVIAARSSGRTGAAIATALAPARLLGSPEACLRAGPGVATEVFGSTRDLLDRMESWVRANPGGVVVHAAAVGDYELEAVPGKIPSGREELLLRLRPAPKIAPLLRRWSPGLSLVTFKAAPPGTSPAELERACRQLLERTGSSLVFGNVLGSLGSDVILVDAGGATFCPDRGGAVEELTRRIASMR